MTVGLGFCLRLRDEDTVSYDTPVSYGELDEHTYWFMMLGILITAFIIMCIGIAGNWFYDILLLRLAPPEYELKLFK
ncbi:hypothetical protein [Bartonella sp. AU55XJBT]|uniref:hypothetical protein n=1 Tax=Bartonella sp. AU55XJBT TaxID=3019091 RepID=UPI0023625E7B|nr:hypothetical protein [Bartonella sp. AU55XJBT]